jgi:hypothetical protein
MVSESKKTKEILKEERNDALNRCKELELEVQKLKDELSNALSNKLSINNQKIKNERGAGRKPLENTIKNEIIELRSMGNSIRKISETLDISIGAVHKIIKDTKCNNVKKIDEKENESIV